MSTNSNDIAFQKFAANVLLRVIERQDQREAHYAKLQADLASANARYAKQIIKSPPLTPSNAQQHPTQSLNSQHFTHLYSQAVLSSFPSTDITDAELEVVRAYHRGENVIEVLLRQER